MTENLHVAAVDLGATNIRTGLIRRDGTVIAFRAEEVPKNSCADGSAVTEKIAAMISSMEKETGTTPDAIGISTAGPVNQKAGSVVGSPNMHCSEILLRDPLAGLFHVPAVMLSDCKAGVIGEYFYGGADSAHTVVYLTISTGIGAGVIANGSLLTGADGNAGEVGHIVVDTGYDIRCGCGGSGHWEAYASGAGIPKFFHAWHAKKCGGHCPAKADISAGQILRAAEIGSPLCCEFVEALATINGRGLSAVINAYNPDLIILDGPIIRNYPSLVAGKMIASIERYLRVPEIRITTLDGKAPLVGAAAAAFRITGQ
ncbi:ROK family protein [Methanocorpusculum vombati]|uniref:ROK family protein n=1 Tax=Methanocorpusculum vombati TaxID=3002864 RepID=A0ABT4IIV8_9EURY|nr:ROK family protein [Methanocorpusculum vombati]MCZ9319099.1 ROK family protein [Methanocorpusculum sp.]MCZ0861681.1 ROK family protein [Methanocorpusculum vombati]MDE2520158.1 ROK family protein [Methanocorpusculum sp.]MDE2535085.1 ROK family protein [Methanocorpusculum sp.]MDE2547632.1 ROK family protein [Methanocorpusculum sp.]